MTEKEHNEIMTNIMKELDKETLDLGDGLAIWHSLGLFLFSQLDKENKDLSVIYANMKEYLDEMQTMNNKSK
ncbi:MAG: hypothetical protein U9Q29_06950 [Campylobacterota bacterium]|nr:hypothetical protein [Campylobacterota bacterium]